MRESEPSTGAGGQGREPGGGRGDGTAGAASRLGCQAGGDRALPVAATEQPRWVLEFYWIRYSHKYDFYILLFTDLFHNKTTFFRVSRYTHG